MRQVETVGQEKPSDIFVSYARPDRARVMPLVHMLEAKGWRVFWDHDIPPGWTWDEYIGERLEHCRVVLVVWSATAVTSEFVRTEAARARKRRAMVPVRIDEVDPPVEFERVHSADLIEWVRQAQTTLPEPLRLELMRRLEPSARGDAPAVPAGAPPAASPVSREVLEALRVSTRENDAARKPAMEELLAAQQAQRDAEVARDRALREKAALETEASRLREELAVARRDADTTRELVMRDSTALEEEVVRLRATASSLTPPRPAQASATPGAPAVTPATPKPATMARRLYERWRRLHIIPRVVLAVVGVLVSLYALAAVVAGIVALVRMG